MNKPLKISSLTI